MPADSQTTSICDCELGHNGLGMAIRECDCDERKAAMVDQDACSRTTEVCDAKCNVWWRTSDGYFVKNGILFTGPRGSATRPGGSGEGVPAGAIEALAPQRANGS